VLAASGRSRVARFFVGSTADRIIREASCPVLVVPAQPGRRERGYGSGFFGELVGGRGALADAERLLVGAVPVDEVVAEALDLVLVDAALDGLDEGAPVGHVGLGVELLVGEAARMPGRRTRV
jgi:hypothetical protein